MIENTFRHGLQIRAIGVSISMTAFSQLELHVMILMN